MKLFERRSNSSRLADAETGTYLIRREVIWLIKAVLTQAAKATGDRPIAEIVTDVSSIGMKRIGEKVIDAEVSVDSSRNNGRVSI